MELTPKEKDLIRGSYARIAGRKQEAGLLFYERLFALDPSLRNMFHRAPIEAQASKLMQVFDWIVERLDRLGEAKAELAALGKKHVEFGVTPDHYAMVGSALVWTMKHASEGGLDAETEAAWIELYTFLSGQMEQ